MDFMKLLNSLDELLYEVMSWLIFFPLTLWRTIISPIEMMQYADQQLNQPEAKQYADALNPPVFLTAALAMTHFGASALGQVDEIEASHRGLSAMIDDDTSALLLRIIVFAIFPLMMAVREVRRTKRPLNRKSLQLPFYAHCYPAAVFALCMTAGTIFTGLPDKPFQIGGWALVVFAVGYYLAVGTLWFSRQAGSGRMGAFGSSLRAMTEAFAIFVVVGILFRS